MISRIHYIVLGVSSSLIFLAVLSLKNNWDFLLKPKFPKELGFTQESIIKEIEPFQIGQDYELINKADKDVNLEEIIKSSGKWSLVHLWATWCPPCQEELVVLAKFPEQFPDIQLIQISVDFRWAQVGPFYNRLGLKLQNYDYLDKGGKGARKIGSTMFPETFLVDPQGKARVKFIGPQQWLGPKIKSFLDLHQKGDSAKF